MRYKCYFSQTEMFTSNVLFGYLCPSGGGQAVQAGLSWPPHRIWVKQCHQLILISEFAVLADVLIFLLPSSRSQFNRCFTGLLVMYLNRNL